MSQCCGIFVFQGAQSTGKTSGMRAMKGFVSNPQWIGTNLTEAALRDQLEKAKNGTAFVEEGDNAHEHLIANRFSRDTASTVVNKQLGKVWCPIQVDYFGATVMHKRKPFIDPATLSRTILVKTRSKPGHYHLTELDDSVRQGLLELWQLAKPMMNELNVSGRVADVWKPLLAVARYCGDESWLQYADREMCKASDKLKLGQESEPEHAIVNALIAKCKSPSVPLAEIKDHIAREYDWQPNSWQVGELIRELGFDVKDSHGKRKVVINKDRLTELACQLGIENALEDIWDISIRDLE